VKTTNELFSSEAQGAAMSPRQAILFLLFVLCYYLLAAYSAALPSQAQFPPPIWLADGLALGALLVAPVVRWVPLTGVVFIASLVVGLQAGASHETAAVAALVNTLEPVLVAAGLLRLAGGRVHLGTLAGMTAFLVNLVPLLAVVSLAEAAASWLRLGGISGRSGRATTFPTFSA
jgi:integral membrane sensor domain MASE1